jgi:hypothetical protein
MTISSGSQFWVIQRQDCFQHVQLGTKFASSSNPQLIYSFPQALLLPLFAFAETRDMSERISNLRWQSYYGCFTLNECFQNMMQARQ